MSKQMVALGRGSLAITTAGLAIMGLAYGDFAPAWSAWPDWMPGRAVWIDGLALLLLAASVGLGFARLAVVSALVIGAYDVLWAVLAAPPIFVHPLSIGVWYGVVEALTALAGTGVLYVLLRWSGTARPAAVARALCAGQVLLGVTCVFYGWSHFVYVEYTAGLVPAWLPGHSAIAYATGGAHIAAGMAMIVGILSRLAATLEAIMMGLFGLFVWVPNFWVDPRPNWATPPQHLWTELVVTLLVAAGTGIVAIALSDRPWGRARRSSL